MLTSCKKKKNTKNIDRIFIIFFLKRYISSGGLFIKMLGNISRGYFSSFLRYLQIIYARLLSNNPINICKYTLGTFPVKHYYYKFNDEKIEKKKSINNRKFRTVILVFCFLNFCGNAS